MVLRPHGILDSNSLDNPRAYSCQNPCPTVQQTAPDQHTNSIALVEAEKYSGPSPGETDRRCRKNYAWLVPSAGDCFDIALRPPLGAVERSAEASWLRRRGAL